MSLSKLSTYAMRLAADAERDPLKYWRPTPIQRQVLEDKNKIVLFRAGNQLGKTMTGCIEVHSRATGRHRWKQIPKKPIDIWIIVHSWEQSKVIQQKFWEMAPKNELTDDTEYIPGKGFKGKYPVVKYKNGSIVYFKTTGQGTLGVASGSVGFVWIDEPPPPD